MRSVLLAVAICLSSVSTVKAITTSVIFTNCVPKMEECTDLRAELAGLRLQLTIEQLYYDYLYVEQVMLRGDLVNLYTVPDYSRDYDWIIKASDIAQQMNEIGALMQASLESMVRISDRMTSIEYRLSQISSCDLCGGH